MKISLLTSSLLGGYYSIRSSTNLRFIALNTAMFQPHLTDHFDSNEALEQIEFVIGDFLCKTFEFITFQMVESNISNSFEEQRTNLTSYTYSIRNQWSLALSILWTSLRTKTSLDSREIFRSNSHVFNRSSSSRYVSCLFIIESNDWNSRSSSNHSNQSVKSSINSSLCLSKNITCPDWLWSIFIKSCWSWTSRPWSMEICLSILVMVSSRTWINICNSSRTRAFDSSKFVLS